jgi:hypothetical protein
MEPQQLTCHQLACLLLLLHCGSAVPPNTPAAVNTRCHSLTCCPPPGLLQSYRW